MLVLMRGMPVMLVPVLCYSLMTMLMLGTTLVSMGVFKGAHVIVGMAHIPVVGVVVDNARGWVRFSFYSRKWFF